MVTYSIKDLESLCGIKAHTIRMWEKRYGLLSANRTKTNIRYYTEDDVRKALNICILYRHGIKISKIAKLTQDEITTLVAEKTELDIPHDKSLDALSIYTLELNEYKFLTILNKYVLEKGFDVTIEQIIYPFLDKISMMWLAGSIDDVHERFVTNIIKRIIVTEINNLTIQKSTRKQKLLLFLPKHGKQELSLLYVEYLLKKQGFSVLNLGLNIVLDHLQVACQNYSPNYIFTILNESPKEESTLNYVKRVSEKICVPLIISGQEVMTLPNSSQRYILMQELNEFLAFVKNLN